MKRFVLAVLVFLCLVTGASAALPTDPNTRDAWYQGDFEGVRVYYTYSSKDAGSSEMNEFACRVDYYHDGRIRLLAVEVPAEPPGSPFSITTFYNLNPRPGQFGGSELVRSSYQLGRGGDLSVRPVLQSYDPFTKRCVPRLANLLGKIPAPEAKMFRDQYGELFSIK